MLSTIPPPTAAIVVHDVRVSVVRTVHRFASCAAAARTNLEDGWGGLHVDYQWTAPQVQDGVNVGTLSARISNARIILPSHVWSGMTPSERGAEARAESALLRHERGHVVVALRALAAQRLPRTFTVPLGDDYGTAAQRLARSLLRDLDDAAAAYDQQTAHGRLQPRASLAETRGPSTQLVCPVPRTSRTSFP